MKSFIIGTLGMLMIAGAATAASLEKATEYNKALVEILDISELSKLSAEIALEQYATMGMNFEGDNKAKALELLTGVYEEVLPSIYEAQIPVVAEIYTDEELDYMKAQLDTEIGRSLKQKAGILSAKASSVSMEMVMPKIMEVMPELQKLVN